MAATARSHTRLLRRDPRAFQRRVRGSRLSNLRAPGTAEFDRWLHLPASDHRRLPRDVRRRCEALLGAPVGRALGPVPSTVWLGDQHLATVLADLLGRALDRFPAARPVPEDPADLDVVVLRLPTTLATPVTPAHARVGDDRLCFTCGERPAGTGYVCWRCRQRASLTRPALPLVLR